MIMDYIQWLESCKWDTRMISKYVFKRSISDTHLKHTIMLRVHRRTQISTKLSMRNIYCVKLQPVVVQTGRSETCSKIQWAGSGYLNRKPDNFLIHDSKLIVDANLLPTGVIGNGAFWRHVELTASETTKVDLSAFVNIQWRGTTKRSACILQWDGTGEKIWFQVLAGTRFRKLFSPNESKTFDCQSMSHLKQHQTMKLGKAQIQI